VEGISPVWPAFGDRLGNQVHYVGRWVDHVYRRFQSRRSFVAALRKGGYNILIVGHGQVPGRVAPEQRWMSADGYRLVAKSSRLSVYQPRTAHTANASRARAQRASSRRQS
jgi:hypothetical protein